MARTYEWLTRVRTAQRQDADLVDIENGLALVGSAELPAGTTIERVLLWTAASSERLEGVSFETYSLTYRNALVLSTSFPSDVWSTDMAGLDVLGVMQQSMTSHLDFSGDPGAWSTTAGGPAGMDIRTGRTVDGSETLWLISQMSSNSFTEGIWREFVVGRVLVLTPE